MYSKYFKSLVWICLICLGVLLAGCVPPTPDATTIEPDAATPAPAAEQEIANPASTNCTEQGGTLTIETRGDGGQYGVCTFEDNRQCEEWALLRGDCPVGGLKVIGYDTPAARYCAITGGTYQIDEAATAGADQEQGNCSFSDGQSCDVWDYYNGVCDPTAQSSGDTEAAATSEPAPEDAQTEAGDPFAYCAAAGTDDAPADETVDGELPDAIVQGMIAQSIIAADAPAAIQQAALWRCMNGNVWVCTVGANLPCGEKADLSETPTQAMEDFCQSNASAEAIPATVTGRATVYSWQCDGETPTVIEQLFTADAQGYLAEFWTELTPQQ